MPRPIPLDAPLRYVSPLITKYLSRGISLVLTYVTIATLPAKSCLGSIAFEDEDDILRLQ